MLDKRIFLLIIVFICSSCASNNFKVSTYQKYNYDGHYKIGLPYKVKNQDYHPIHNESYDEIGIASWYGPGFHGKKTANGETYNQRALTAAHKTLPLPSLVRVTNLENGRSAVLMVNDRGPYADNRIIDLSMKSAEILGIKEKGLAEVRVQYLADESNKMHTELKLNSQKIKEIARHKNRIQNLRNLDEGIYIQLAAFKNEINAKRLLNQVKNHANAHIQLVKVDDEEFFRVNIGPFENDLEAQKEKTKIITASQGLIKFVAN